jgi:hypothetical protein
MNYLQIMRWAGRGHRFKPCTAHHISAIQQFTFIECCLKWQSDNNSDNKSPRTATAAEVDFHQVTTE